MRPSEPVVNTRRPLCWRHVWCDAKVEKEAGQLLIAVAIFCLSTDATLFVWYQLCCSSFYLCIYACMCRYLGDGDTNRRESLHASTYLSRTQRFPFWVGAVPPRGPKSQFLTSNISKTVSRSVIYSMPRGAFVNFSTFGGDIFWGLQIGEGGANVFGQYVFDIA